MGTGLISQDIARSLTGHQKMVLQMPNDNSRKDFLAWCIHTRKVGLRWRILIFVSYYDIGTVYMSLPSIRTFTNKLTGYVFFREEDEAQAT
jgi:hypothetical protein